MCEEIKKLISEGDTNEAIKELLKKSNDEKIVLISNKYQNLVSEFGFGLLNKEDYDVGIQNINNTIIKLVCNDSKNDDIQRHSKDKNKLIISLFLFIIFIILGFGIYKFYLPNRPEINEKPECECPIKDMEVENKIGELVEIVDSMGINGNLDFDIPIKSVNGELRIGGKSIDKFYSKTQIDQISNFKSFEKEIFYQRIAASQCCLKYLHYCKKEYRDTAKLNEVIEDYYHLCDEIKLMLKQQGMKQDTSPPKEKETTPVIPEKDKIEFEEITLHVNKIDDIENIKINDNPIEYTSKGEAITFKIPKLESFIVTYKSKKQKKGVHNGTQKHFSESNLKTL